MTITRTEPELALAELQRLRVQAERLADAIREMRIAFIANRHAQEWAAFIKRRVHLPEDGPTCPVCGIAVPDPAKTCPKCVQAARTPEAQLLAAIRSNYTTFDCAACGQVTAYEAGATSETQTVCARCAQEEFGQSQKPESPKP